VRAFRDEKRRIILCLTLNEYREIEDIIINEERVSFDQLLRKGVENCILNHLRGVTIAVLDPELDYYMRKGDFK